MASTIRLVLPAAVHPTLGRVRKRFPIEMPARQGDAVCDRYRVAVVGTPWDARTYDVSSQPQQAWTSEVLARLEGIAPDASLLDVGCGTGRVTEALLAIVPRGRILAVDASEEMVALARACGGVVPGRARP